MSKQFIFNILTIQQLRFQIVNRPGMRQEFIVHEGYVRTSKEKCQPTPGACGPGERERPVQVAWPSLCVSKRKTLPWEQAASGTPDLCQPLARGRAQDLTRNLPPEGIRREETAEQKPLRVRGNA